MANVLRQYAVALMESEGVPIGVELIYDPAHPLVITFNFYEDDIQWWVSRDLLANGMLRLSGRGEVSVKPTDDGCVRVRLQGGDSVQIFRFGSDFMNRFLVDTYTEVPEGEELPTLWNDLDNTLNKILMGA